MNHVGLKRGLWLKILHQGTVFIFITKKISPYYSKPYDRAFEKGKPICYESHLAIAGNEQYHLFLLQSTDLYAYWPP